MGQHMRYQYLSHRPVAKAQTRLRMLLVLPSLLTYTNYGSSRAPTRSGNYGKTWKIKKKDPCMEKRGFFQQFWEKASGQNWEKMIDLTPKLGEINDIEHNKGSKIYPQNQVILDCIMPSIPLKYKCLSIIHHFDMGHCFS